MLSHHREIRDFLASYGAKAIEITHNGGPHPKFEFDFKDRHYLVPVHSSSSDPNAVNRAIADFKKQLGPPVEEVRDQSRKLEDMLPPAANRPRYVGGMALYKQAEGGPRMSFIIPWELAERLNLKGQAARISRLDKDVWLITPIGPVTSKRDRYFRGDGKQCLITCSAPEITKGYDLFGSSSAEYAVVGNDLVVHLGSELNPLKAPPLVKPVRPPPVRPPPAYKLPRETQPVSLPPAVLDLPEAPPTPPHPAPVPAVLGDGQVIPVDTYLKLLIERVTRAEAVTLYKLRRVHKENGEEYWAWRAPEIKLDD